MVVIPLLPLLLLLLNYCKLVLRFKFRAFALKSSKDKIISKAFDLIILDWTKVELKIVSKTKRLGALPVSFVQPAYPTLIEKMWPTSYMYLVLHSTCKVTCYFRLFSSVLVSVLRTSIDVLSMSKSRNYVTWIANLTKLFLSVYTANIFEVIFTVFNCVRISTVISLYGLHFIAAPSTV